MRQASDLESAAVLRSEKTKPGRIERRRTGHLIQFFDVTEAAEIRFILTRPSKARRPEAKEILRASPASEHHRGIHCGIHKMPSSTLRSGRKPTAARSRGSLGSKPMGRTALLGKSGWRHRTRFYVDGADFRCNPAFKCCNRTSRGSTEMKPSDPSKWQAPALQEWRADDARGKPLQGGRWYNRSRV